MRGLYDEAVPVDWSEEHEVAKTVNGGGEFKLEPHRTRWSKGKRPQFHDDPAVDRVLSIVMTLAGEVSVLRERLDAHERLAAKRNLYGPEDVDSFIPDEGAERARNKWREAFLRRVFRAVEQDIEALAPSGVEDEDYDDIIREIEGPTVDEP